MRRPELLDPAVARDLDALDAALAGAPGTDPELVALAADVRAAAPRDGDRWTPADAWRDARRGLEIAAGVAIVAAALALPLGLVATPAALALGALRRRRREGALDAA
jgi:hypothetical protein